MSFRRLNQYTEKKNPGKLNNNSNTQTTNNNNKSPKSTNNKSSKADRPLPRATTPGNFNVNYDTLEIRIPNYTFGKAIELAGAGGLIAVSLGKRYDYIYTSISYTTIIIFTFLEFQIIVSY